jgi:hypothetical protein
MFGDVRHLSLQSKVPLVGGGSTASYADTASISNMDARTRKLVEQMMKVQSMQSRP